MPTNGKEPQKDHERLQPTSGSEWRRAREEGYTVPLPSGKVATLRPVALDQLLRNGSIPDLLSPVAARALWQETDSDKIAENPKLNKDYLELIDLIVPLALMMPKVVENPKGEGEIAFEDIDFMDKVGIFNLAIQPAELLKTFRDQQESRLSTLRDSKNNIEQAEPVG